MEEKTTPEEGHSEEVEETTEDVNEAGKEEATDKKDKRELNPEEMQKTLSRQFTEIDRLKKEVEEAKQSKGTDDEVAAKVVELEKKVSRAEFFAENPQYKQHEDLIKRFGDNAEEVVKSEEFQNVFKAVSAYNQSASGNTLKSNPRLAQTQSDAMDKAKKSLSAEDWADVLKERGIN